jgi:hypothetical protein
MIPPNKIDITDKNHGFTAITTKQGDTLWRPIRVLLYKNLYADLQSYDENSFYQLNDNVTKAIYKVRGYRYPIVCWFDNLTLERIA